MDRGAMFAESHDLMLRKLPETTGKPLAFWLRLLDSEGFQKKGFLAGIQFLRDHKKVPHNEAASIMYTYMNPYLAPDELRGRSKDQDLAATLEGTKAANRRLRRKAGKARPIRPAPKKPARTAVRPAPKKKPVRKAARPAAKRKPARTAVRPVPKKKPARTAVRPAAKKKPVAAVAKRSARPPARKVKRPARASAKKAPRQAAKRPRARRSRR